MKPECEYNHEANALPERPDVFRPQPREPDSIREFLSVCYRILKKSLREEGARFYCTPSLAQSGDLLNLLTEPELEPCQQIRLVHKAVQRRVHQAGDLKRALAEDMMKTLLRLLLPPDGEILVTAFLPEAFDVKTVRVATYDIALRLVLSPAFQDGNWIVDVGGLFAWAKDTKL